MNETVKLFDKAVVFTDIHYGLKNNNKTHLLDCMGFIDFLIDEAKKQNIKTCIFCGDYHHIRNTINVETMNYSIKALRRLSNAFDNVYMVRGNHDEYYKDTRNATSIEFGRDIQNIHIIDNPIVIDNVAFIPWLVNDEWKHLKINDVKYVFSHFALPGFKVNVNKVYTDDTKLTPEMLTNNGYVFCGHFHKRQKKNNIYYIGNCFPHDFNDNKEEKERGIMILEWGKEPQFINWEDSPKYRIDNIDKLCIDVNEVNDKTYIRCINNTSLNTLQLQFIKECFVKGLNVREFSYSNISSKSDDMYMDDDVVFETVDGVVISELSKVDSDILDNNLLIEMYNSLDISNRAIDCED